MKNIWTELKKPFLVLAPMAGYTDSAFRLLCREYGADVVVTELISADAIAYGKFQVSIIHHQINGKDLKYFKVDGGKNHNTAEMLSFFEAEKPLIVQLFGKHPEKFALAAKWISENLPVDGIDINMGCPARKVVGSDHGAALLKNPDLAVEIVKAVKENTHLPVSVKTRLGWSSDDEILDFVPRLVEAGISAITIHGRTYKDGFKGQARWGNIYKVKEMLGDKIKVIGNGDLGQQSAFSSQHSVEGLDGVAVGRASFGKPWLFGTSEGDVSLFDQRRLSGVIKRHSELVWATKGEKGMMEFRKHLLAYLKGFGGAKELRAEAVAIKTLEDVRKIMDKLK